MKIGDTVKAEPSDKPGIRANKARVMALIVNPDREIPGALGTTIRAEIEGIFGDLGRHRDAGWTAEAKHIAFTIATYLNNLPPATIQELPVASDDTIWSLELSIRADNCLKRAGIVKITQLIAWSENELLGIKGLGGTSLREIIYKLSERGLRLKQ